MMFAGEKVGNHNNWTRIAAAAAAAAVGNSVHKIPVVHILRQPGVVVAAAVRNRSSHILSQIHQVVVVVVVVDVIVDCRQIGYIVRIAHHILADNNAVADVVEVGKHIERQHNALARQLAGLSPTWSHQEHPISMCDDGWLKG